MSVKLLISGENVVNINSYLGNINPTSITSRNLEFTNEDTNGSKIIGQTTYLTTSSKSQSQTQSQSNIVYTDYSEYFPILDPPSNEASILDLFNNKLFYQVPNPIYNIIYEGNSYTVEKVMNIGANIIMLMNLDSNNVLV
jgi:hypothetical protein